jgi:Domain of unknown function (DUF4279)
MNSYDDDYPTCKKTYTTLRIFSESISPQKITTLFGIDPTDSFVKDDAIGKCSAKQKQNGWFLSTETKVLSKDFRRHLDWIISVIIDYDDAVKNLHLNGAEIDISCYWVSMGQGGPAMSCQQMKQLGHLGIDIWWDIYFDSTHNHG